MGYLISGMLVESHCFPLKEALLGLLESVTVYGLSTDGNCRHPPPSIFKTTHLVRVFNTLDVREEGRFWKSIA